MKSITRSLLPIIRFAGCRFFFWWESRRRCTQIFVFINKLITVSVYENLENIQTSFKPFTWDQKFLKNYCKFVNHITLYIINYMYIRNIRFVYKLDIIFESTFESLCGIVGLVTFGKYIVAFSWLLTLNNSSSNIVFCAMSLKSQMKNR